MPTLALGFVVNVESDSMVERAVTHALDAYKDSLQDLLIVSKTERSFDFLPKRPKVVYYLDNKRPQFLNMQELYHLYLDQSSAEYLVTIDPDTIILKWDRSFYDLAGRFIYYDKPWLLNYWNKLPRSLQQILINVFHRGCIHTVQGGWSMRSRKIASLMSEYFVPDFRERTVFHYRNEWTGEILPEGSKALAIVRLTEPPDWSQVAWGGHEMIFGHYLERLARQKRLPSVKELLALNPLDPEGLRFRVLEGAKIAPSALKTAEVVHPIKTDQDYALLLEKLKALEKTSD